MKNKIVGLVKKYGGSALDRSLRFRCFQDYVNSHNNENLIKLPYLDGYYLTNDVFKFHLSSRLFGINSVRDDYNFDDILKEDIVLNIGANVGIFSIFASRHAKFVYAIEPLFSDVLRSNIELNGIGNVKVLDIGLGKRGRKKVCFDGREKIIDLVPLSEILKLVGKCDFLKIDCEGCEWDIIPSELEGFRRIEGELHNFDKKYDFSDFEKMLVNIGFECIFENNNGRTCLIHAKKEK